MAEPSFTHSNFQPPPSCRLSAHGHPAALPGLVIEGGRNVVRSSSGDGQEPFRIAGVVRSSASVLTSGSAAPMNYISSHNQMAGPSQQGLHTHSHAHSSLHSATAHMVRCVFV